MCPEESSCPFGNKIQSTRNSKKVTKIKRNSLVTSVRDYRKF